MRLFPAAVGALFSTAMLLGACGLQDSLAGEAQQELQGYGGLILGSTFEQAMLIASPSDFNSYGYRECLEDMPIRGCFLSPASELSTFRRIGGIPYGLQLDFNRLGALTDITLTFSRGRTYDLDLNPIRATITKSECQDIVERTVDWVTAEYGQLASEPSDSPDEQLVTTSAGNAYWISSASSRSRFIATGDVSMSEGRRVGIFAHFFLIDGEPDCDISVSFEEARRIERRPPDEPDQ
jgi:hypothetical protein